MIFMIASIIVLWMIVYSIPKRLSVFEMYTTSLLFAVVDWSVLSVFLDVRYNWVGYFDKGADYRTLLVIAGIDPAVNLLMLNFFPFRKHFVKKLAYLAGCTFLLCFYEFMNLKIGFKYYTKWNLGYTALYYVSLFSLLAFNLYVFRKLSAEVK